VGTLAAGASASCTKSSTAVAGQHSNIGKVTGFSSLIGLVTDTNEDHHFGAQPKIAIVKTTNGTDSDSPRGPFIRVGSPVKWSYDVTNTGNVPLRDVTVTDSDPSLVVSCDTTTLAAGSAMRCLASGTAAVGQYENTGSVTGKFGPVNVNG